MSQTGGVSPGTGIQEDNSPARAKYRRTKNYLQRRVEDFIR